MARAMKKTAAVAVAAGLAFGGSAGIADAPLAFAQEGDPAESNATGYSLTIQKRDLAGQEATPATDETLRGDGTNVPGQTPETAAGFKFKIEKVTPGEGASKNDASKAVKDSSFTEREATTDGEGKIRFDKLPAGVYRVTETAVPAGSGFVAGPAFLVSVPVTNDAGTGTINDVHVYPKNTRAGIEKTVQDKDKNAGQDYTYTIKSDIPKPAVGESLESYRVTDSLDGRLALQKVEIKVGTDWDSATPVDSANYTLTPSGGTAEAGTASTPTTDIEVNFNEDGRKLLAGQDAGAKVLTRITATAPENVDVVPNTSTLYFNNGSGTGEVKRDSDEVKTYWGTLKINKKAQGEEGQPLKGAEFRLVKCQAGENGYNQIPNTDDLTVNGESSWTTNEDGTVSITGIHATDFADNAADDTLLCAQETKAPAGFQLDKRLIPFVLRSGEGTQADLDMAAFGNDVTASANGLDYEFTLVNKPGDRFLPNTGGMGITLLILVGLGIIGGGVYAARRNSA